MNTQFEHGKYRYIPGPPVRFNGTLGRLWERRELQQGCWVFCGRQFHAARATRRDIGGFSLIELLIVVAIIGILAAIAIPQYNVFITRAKVSELLASLAACKTSVGEYRMTNSAWPADMAASGCSDQDTKYVSALAIGANGIVTATAKTGPNAIDAAAGGVLELRPTLLAGGQIDWVCNGAGTTIPAKYVPANCRP